MTDTLVIYVVGFSPDFGDTVHVGGHDWRPTWEEAVEVLREHLAQGNSGHDYVLRSVRVPRTLTRDQITDYLSGEGNYLIELPLPEEWVL